MNWIEPLLPKRWDLNEWYTTAICILVIVIIWLLPRRFPVQLSYFVYVFNWALAAFGDYLLAGKPYDLYDTLDKDAGELMDFPLHLLAYPGMVYLLLYAYDRWRPNKIAFVLVSVLLTAGMEWISETFFRLFTYKHWNIGLSVLVYVGVYTLNLMVFEKVKRALTIKEKEPFRKVERT